MVRQLESMLTLAERKERELGLEALRTFIQRAASKGGTTISRPKSFPYPVIRGIRVDLEVITGMIAVPDKSKS